MYINIYSVIMGLLRELTGGKRRRRMVEID
jgi:hypothetical protein